MIVVSLEGFDLLVPISNSAKAQSLDEILGGRFLVGLGIGVNTVLVPIYISEVHVTITTAALHFTLLSSNYGVLTVSLCL